MRKINMTHCFFIAASVVFICFDSAHADDLIWNKRIVDEKALAGAKSNRALPANKLRAILVAYEDFNGRLAEDNFLPHVVMIEGLGRNKERIVFYIPVVVPDLRVQPVVMEPCFVEYTVSIMPYEILERTSRCYEEFSDYRK